MIFRRWRRQRDERIATSEEATERTKRLARAVTPLIGEAHAVTAWAERRIEENHLAALFVSAADWRRR